MTSSEITILAATKLLGTVPAAGLVQFGGAIRLFFNLELGERSTQDRYERLPKKVIGMTRTTMHMLGRNRHCRREGLDI